MPAEKALQERKDKIKQLRVFKGVRKTEEEGVALQDQVVLVKVGVRYFDFNEGLYIIIIYHFISSYIK